jgi:hypothetical protein
MKRPARTILAVGTTLGLIAIALAAVPALLPGNDSRRGSPPGKLIVHEWGTFTSFAGDNGVELEFRPLVTSDLPRFIMNPFSQPGSPTSFLLKDQFTALQRMETPVTYFYTDEPRVVNVRVDFPQGSLTEWYPVVKKFDSGVNNDTNAIVGHSYLDWGTVRLTPEKQFASVRVRDAKGKAIPASLPRVDAGDHYARARETDSAIVETVDANRGSHFEKFLFYRGLGNFELPIKLVAQRHDRFEVSNSGEEPSGALLLVRIENGHVRFTRLDPVGPRSSIDTTLPSEQSTVDRLAEATVHELIAAGLYNKEALAMVNTWRTSWFGENGTRLLYLVPGKLTDKLLPLSVDPAPDQCVRVLVGRLETLTPEDCQRLVRTLGGSKASDKPAEAAVKAELTSLGRFAEPAINFMIGQTSDQPTRDRLKAILAEVRKHK